MVGFIGKQNSIHENLTPKTTQNSISLPNFNAEIKKNSQLLIYDTSNGIPPFCTTNFSVTENGNTTPNILKSTFYVVPSKNSILESINLPFSFIMNPFNNKSYFYEIADEPVCCMQCHGYLNYFSKIQNNTFICNLCNSVTKSEKYYNFPTAEYKINKSYKFQKKEVINDNYFDLENYAPPLIIFCLEVSKISISTNFYFQCIDAIERVLEDSSKKVAFIVYTDELIVLKNKKNRILEEKILDSSEFPFNKPDVVFDLNMKTEILNYLRQLEPKNSTFSMLSLLKGLIGFGNFFVGTKVLLFTSNSKEEFLVEIVQDMFIQQRISLNLFTIGKNESLEKVVMLTNGRTVKFLTSTDDLFSNLYNIYNEKSVYGVTMQIKTSDQISKSRFIGNGDTESTNLAIFSQMDSKSTVLVSFYIDEEIKDLKVYFQAIFNYYKEDCQRYVLVCNLSLDVSSELNVIYNNLCADTIFCANMKIILYDYENYSDKKKSIQDDLVRCLNYFRKRCTTNPSPAHLHLPENIKLLPLLSQSANKNHIFNTEKSLYNFSNVLSFSVLKNLRFFYPRLFTFSDYFEKQSLDKITLLPLSQSSIDSNEIYILDNGEKVVIYFGSEVLDELKDVLINKVDCEEKRAFDQLIEDLCCEYFCILPLVFIEQGSVTDNDMLVFFVEDRLYGHGDYEEYVCDLHGKVKNS